MFTEPSVSVSCIRGNAVLTSSGTSVTAVLVSRFLLDLQAANRRALRLDSQDLSQGETSAQGFPAGSIMFNRVVGSLGSSIEPGSFEDVGTEDDSATPSCDSDIEGIKERSSEPDTEALELF